MLKTILTGLFVFIPVVCYGFLFSGPNWNGLKVTWGYSIFSSFNDVPRTQIEARRDGWVAMVMSSGCRGDSKFKGERYIKNNDMGVIAIYDAAGYIAGIQIGFPVDYHDPEADNYPPQTLINSPLVLDDGYYFLTSYFVNPDIICTGRTERQYEDEGTGIGLWIQNGTHPLTDSINIPILESDIQNTMWTRGHCFYTMGVHYWYNVRRDMSCDEFFPVFLMYNGGRLNAFGWALGLNIETSEYLEHPPKSTYDTFLQPVPDCLMRKGTMTTLHIYMTDSPLTNWC